MALGRGLSSLIPNRRQTTNFDEDVEAIDSMEVMQDETTKEKAIEVAEEPQSQPVGIPVIEEDDDNGFQPLSTYEEPKSLEVTEEEDVDTQDVISQAPAAITETEEPVTMKVDQEVAEEKEVASEEPVSKFDDFDQLNDGESVPAPDKPLVTPLELDPQEDSDLIDLAQSVVVAQHTGNYHQSRTQISQKPPVQKKVAPKAVVEEEPKKEVVAEQPAEVIAANKVSELEKKASEVVKKPAPVPEKVSVAKAEGSQMEDIGDKSDQHEGTVQRLAIGDIVINPLQPRRNFEPAEMAELKESIDQHGILQPLVVQRLEDGTYQLIAGERRLRASKELGWSKVPCVVRIDVSSDQTRLVYALIENIQRENLNPIEMALAYQRLHDEYGLSHEEIGQRMGKARVSITNALRVLQLPAEVQRGLIEGKISSGHARAILMIPDEEKQVRFYQHLLDEGLTVRKAETRARRIQRTMGVHDPQRQKRRTRHPLAQKYAPALEERFATDANVKFNEEKNRFEVVLKAYSVNEFETLVGRLLGTADMPDLSVDDEIAES